jgi:hypothetical protein
MPGLMSVIGIAVLVLVGAAGSASAGPATTSSWQISKVLSDPSGYAGLASVDAVSASDAWAGGQADQMPYVMHWDGRSWVNLTPRNASFHTPNTSIDAIGATGQNNAWALVDSVTDGYAMGWNGSSWRKFSFHRYLIAIGIDVLSARNVWAFGINGDWTPFCMRFDGSRWRPVAMPAVPYAVSKPSAAGIWAAGPTVSSSVNSSGPPRDVLLRWTGKSWWSVKFPPLGMTRNQEFLPNGMLAVSARDVWVTGDVQPIAGGGRWRHELLHWDGGGWHVYPSAVTLGNIAPDGSGGLWIGEFLNLPTTPGGFAHFTKGRWQSTPAPVPPSADPNQVPLVSDLALIPGSHRLWAVGLVAAYGFQAVIYKYGT